VNGPSTFDIGDEMGGAQLSRRTLLAAGLFATTGCSAVARTAGLGDSVRVAVSWSTTELAAFRNVLADGQIDDYELIPLGDDIDAALGARTTGRPDVVALPKLGHVADNVENLVPLPDDVWHPSYNRIWPQNVPYALPFKLAHSSVVWYRRKLFEDRKWTPPKTWAEWQQLNAVIAESGLAPLALGGADGWMLDGWFENVLLRNFPGTFDALAKPHSAQLWTSSEVRTTFEMLADMWSKPGAVSGGPRRALVQQFPDAVLDVFRYNRAAMVVVPDFAESVVRRFGVPDDEVATFTFPGTGPLVVKGDLLVMTRPAGRGAIDLISYLAGREAPRPWIKDTGGFIAANPDTDRGLYSPTLARLADELRQHEVRFDLSDQLGLVGGREGLQRVLQDFLEALGEGTRPAQAVRTAIDQMVSAER
jgi:alpha-glucoside transport system substrate-binding protein